MSKTGTTAIQKFFEANREALQPYGISYPYLEQRGARPYRNGHFLSTRDYDSDLDKHNWGIVESELKQYDKVLLSDETLFREGGDVSKFWEMLKRRTQKAGASLKAIVYIRRQDDFFWSYYIQLVQKLNRSLSLSESILKEWMYMPCWNYYQYIKRIESVIGKENIIVRIYDRNHFKSDRGNIVDDTLEIFGVGPDQYQNLEFESKAVNPSIGDLTAAAKRYYNQVFVEHRTKLQYHVLNQLLYSADQKLSDEGMLKKRTGMTSDIRKKVLDKYEKSNKQLAREYFGREDLFFDKTIDKGDAEAVFSRDELAHTYDLWVDDIENYPRYGYSRQQMRELCDEALKLYDRGDHYRFSRIRQWGSYIKRVMAIKGTAKKHTRTIEQYWDPQ